MRLALRLSARLTALLTLAGLVALAGATGATAKTVALIDNSFNDNFLNNGEGWVRASGVLNANIQIAGSFTDGLAKLVNGDDLIIVAHSTGAGNFVWNRTVYTGFGNAANEMPVPGGFVSLEPITVQFVTCYSSSAPSGGGDSILFKLLRAMPSDFNSGTGFVGTACTHVIWNMSNGTAAQYTAAEVCLGQNNSSWVQNPPANRPATGGQGQPANQRSVGQARMDNNCQGVPANTLTFNIPNRVGVLDMTTGYAPPTDGGVPFAGPAGVDVDSLSVCGDGANSHAPDDQPSATESKTWGSLKRFFK